MLLNKQQAKGRGGGRASPQICFLRRYKLAGEGRRGKAMMKGDSGIGCSHFDAMRAGGDPPPAKGETGHITGKQKGFRRS